ncbi:MAG: hypothetical protein BGO01_04240 [Armatimonadetes bacterium 55-13]|nr:phosphonatase-like hydrolase [Armatimonadota bacterium]OJU63359.1 MAG: hypothetical protein BGO01_04240 [Armatimonadetes bacterium 55-13]
MKIQAVIFDLAGTTVQDDNSVVKCLDDALRAGGYEVAFAELNGRMGIPKPLAVRQVATGASDEEIEAIHADFQRRMIAFYRETPDVKEIEGASDTFRWLKSKGIKIGLDTGFDRATVEVLLNRLPWQGLIDASVTSDEVERGRPHPDLIFEAMKRLGVSDVEAVAKVGDTPSDLGEGTSAGCGMVIGVWAGTHTQEQLSSYPHTHLIESVADLPSLLERLDVLA